MKSDHRRHSVSSNSKPQTQSVLRVVWMWRMYDLLYIYIFSHRGQWARKVFQGIEAAKEGRYNTMQTNKHTHREADRQTGRQTGRQTDRQTDR